MRSRLLKSQRYSNYIVATYNVTSTAATSLIYSGIFNNIKPQIKYMIVDGVAVDKTNSYSFTEPGEHEVEIHFLGKLNSCSQLFYGCSSLTAIDLSHFDTSNVTNMSYMFHSCSSLNEIRMGGDISKVTNTGGIFTGINRNGGTFYYNSNYDYSKLTSLLPSNWTAIPV